MAPTKWLIQWGSFTRIHPWKTNMTMATTTISRCMFLSTNWWFSINILSFSGVVSGGDSGPYLQLATWSDPSRTNPFVHPHPRSQQPASPQVSNRGSASGETSEENFGMGFWHSRRVVVRCLFLKKTKNVSKNGVQQKSMILDCFFCILWMLMVWDFFHT